VNPWTESRLLGEQHVELLCELSSAGEKRREAYKDQDWLTFETQTRYQADIARGLWEVEWRLETVNGLIEAFEKLEATLEEKFGGCEHEWTKAVPQHCSKCGRLKALAGGGTG
jgi:hypothetical protein